MSEHPYVRAVAGHTAVHYGSHGTAECGADYSDMALTTVPSNVTCRTCRGWLPIVHDWNPSESATAADAVDPQASNQESGPRAQESSSLSADFQLSQLREGLQTLITAWRAAANPISPWQIDECAKQLTALLAAADGSK